LFSLERTEIYTAAIIASCSGLVALYGLAETVLAFNPLYAFWVDNPFYQRYIEFPVRPMSTQFNPAVLATYLACSLPFSWALSRSQSNLAKWIGRISLIVGVACLILTFSRGSILAAFVAWLFIIFLLGKKQQVKLILSSAVIVSSLATFLPYPFMRLSPFGFTQMQSGVFSSYRRIRTDMALRMFSISPLTGVGLEHFRVLFERFYPEHLSMEKTDYEHRIADNMYLTWFAETGLLGSAGLISCVSAAWTNGLRRVRRLRGHIQEGTSIAALAALLVFLVSMFGYEAFYWTAPLMFFSLICGFLSQEQA